MILTKAQIAKLGIISNGVAQGWRATSYDATVGDIIIGGTIVSDTSFQLEPRGVAWVVSSETFSLPDTVTGVATLRTTWTHKGILALNVGIVDPMWTGSLATAIVNLSNSTFTISKDDQFFRVVFHRHRAAGASASGTPRPVYLNTILEKSRLFTRTFLDTDSLVEDVANKVLGFPRWALRLGAIAFVVSLLAIFVPIAFNVWTDYYQGPEKYKNLETRIEDLHVDKIDDKINSLERDVAILRAEKQAPPSLPPVRTRVIRQPVVPSITVNANR